MDIYDQIKLGVRYLANFKTFGNSPKNKPHKSKFHGRHVIIKENNPMDNDIPSFEHGFVHVYDAESDKYYGACGIFYFARTIGIEV